MEESMPASGHVTASGRAVSRCSMAGEIKERISGISFYRFVSELDASFDERFDEIVAKMQESIRQTFSKDHLLVDYTAGKDASVNTHHLVDGKGACWWWLRTPGGNNLNAVIVGADGTFAENGFYVNYDFGSVRPAMWVSLD